MNLKSYQSRIIGELSVYLQVLWGELNVVSELANSDKSALRAMAENYDFPREAWKKLFPEKPFYSKQDGMGRCMPDVFIKVPTGGGKTLLAAHAVNKIRHEFMHRPSGLTLWIVPTEQIYRQTYNQLRDRAHPYRQMLDAGGNGRAKICRRTDKFSRHQCASGNVVLLLMMPAANRVDQSQLRMYRDAGAYQDFFPPATDVAKRRALKAAIPNLECTDDGDAAPHQIIHSLGNVLRLHRPLVIIDEGQKMISELARRTLANFNPEFVLELSATPPDAANVLAGASGRELLDEEMIKLDINLANQTVPDWHQTLFAAKQKRDELEAVAQQHAENGGRYIRPIMLVQVENTGAKQRDGKKIHSEDARDYLMTKCGVPSHEIVVKSSELNELGDMNLLSQKSHVRYIITQRALQEGWDCSFAYVLAVLSNMKAAASLQQLVGRVLRQPYATKTGIRALDECYVFANRPDTGEMVRAIKKDLEKAGMGDLSTGIYTCDKKDVGELAGSHARRESLPRSQFKQYAGRVYLPHFVIETEGGARMLEYGSDILQHLDWANLQPRGLEKLSLSDKRHDVKEITLSFTSHGADVQATGGRDIYLGVEADPVLMSMQLVDVVPNPWRAFRQARTILAQVEAQESARGVVNGFTPKQRVNLNFSYITQEAKRLLGEARDEMAQAYFRQKVEEGVFKLMLLTSGKHPCVIPKRLKLLKGPPLFHTDGMPVRRSLFDTVPADGFNNTERSVALYLDEQERLLWWYRNLVHDGYSLQGWQKHRVYPDFIAATKRADADSNGGKKSPIDSVLVLELKGTHLQGSADSDYKQSLMQLCDELCRSDAQPRLCKWETLSDEFYKHRFRFQLVREEEYKTVINSLLAD